MSISGRIRILALSFALLGALVGTTYDAGASGGEVATVSHGSTAARGDTRWHPYREEDLVYPAGERCAFRVRAHVLRDREEYRDVSFWPNGQVRTQLFRGPLVIRWTNLRTGRHVRRDQSGRAIFEYDRAGNPASLTALTGHFGAGLSAGSDPGKGIFYVGGRWTSVVFHPDDTRTLVLGPHGTRENLCRTLG